MRKNKYAEYLTPARVNEKLPDGHSGDFVLIRSIRYQIPLLSEVLAIPGLDIELRDSFGWSALMYASRHGQVFCDVYANRSRPFTPQENHKFLRECLLADNKPGYRMLMSLPDEEMDINDPGPPDPHYSAPAIFACMHNPSILLEFVRHPKCDPNVTNFCGHTVIDACVLNGWFDETCNDKKNVVLTCMNHPRANVWRTWDRMCAIEQSTRVVRRTAARDALRTRIRQDAVKSIYLMRGRDRHLPTEMVQKIVSYLV